MYEIEITVIFPMWYIAGTTPEMQHPFLVRTKRKKKYCFEDIKYHLKKWNTVL